MKTLTFEGCGTSLLPADCCSTISNTRRASSQCSFHWLNVCLCDHYKHREPAMICSPATSWFNLVERKLRSSMKPVAVNLVAVAVVVVVVRECSPLSWTCTLICINSNCPPLISWTSTRRTRISMIPLDHYFLFSYPFLSHFGTARFRLTSRACSARGLVWLAFGLPVRAAGPDLGAQPVAWRDSTCLMCLLLLS